MWLEIYSPKYREKRAPYMCSLEQGKGGHIQGWEEKN
jgi:hypothetical protein